MSSVEPKDFFERYEKFFNLSFLEMKRKKKEPKLSPQGLEYASFNRRMLAGMFDSLLLTMLILPFNGYFMEFIYGDFTIDQSHLLNLAQTSQTQEEYNQRALEYVSEQGFSRVIFNMIQLQYSLIAGFSFFFWHFYSSTPGKMLLRMRIVDFKTGEKINDWQAFLRVFAYLISAIPLMFGFWWVAFSKTKRGWHDYMARTAVVVLPRKAKPETTEQPETVPPSDSPEPKVTE